MDSFVRNLHLSGLWLSQMGLSPCRRWICIVWKRIDFFVWDPHSMRSYSSTFDEIVFFSGGLVPLHASIFHWFEAAESVHLESSYEWIDPFSWRLVLWPALISDLMGVFITASIFKCWDRWLACSAATENFPLQLDIITGTKFDGKIEENAISHWKLKKTLRIRTERYEWIFR